MEETKSVIKGEFDRSGQYDSGLKSLVKSLQWAFAFLLVVIIAMLLYFFTGGGYFAVEPQRAVIVLKFGQMLPETYTSGGHWFLPYPVHQFIRIQTNQQFMDVNFIAAEMPGEGAPQSLEPGRDSYLLTGDANIIHASWSIGYQVTNPARYYETLNTPPRPVENGRVMPDETVLVMIAPPSMEELEKRLAGRGSESDAEREDRLRRVRYELEQSDLYDYVLVNEDSRETKSKILEIIRREKEKKI